ncbi:hypothetical protein ACOMHN_021834 [Nucella lapillus]
MTSTTCLLLLLMTTGCPVSMTSLPTSMTAPQQRLLNFMDSSEEFRDLRTRYIASLQRQPASQMEAISLQEADNDDESGPDEEGVTRRTREMQNILDLIYRQILELGRHRQAFQDREKQQAAMLERERLYDSIKRGPSNHFLRIGRGGVDLNHDSGSDVPSLYNVLKGFHGMSDYLSPFKNRISELTRNELKDVHEFEDMYDDIGDESTELDSSEAKNKFMLSRRSFSPQNSFVRIGRRAFSPENKFVKRGLSEEGHSDDARMLRDYFPVVRRSYVRIGRLPASVFRRRQVVDDADAGSFANRRSSGFRLTKSGILRAGKRSP